MNEIISISDLLKGNLKIKESTVEKLRKNLRNIRDLLDNEDFNNKNNQVEKMGILKSMEFDATDEPSAQVAYDKEVQVELEDSVDSEDSDNQEKQDLIPPLSSKNINDGRKKSKSSMSKKKERKSMVVDFVNTIAVNNRPRKGSMVSRKIMSFSK